MLKVDYFNHLQYMHLQNYPRLYYYDEKQLKNHEILKASNNVPRNDIRYTMLFPFRRCLTTIKYIS